MKRKYNFVATTGMLIALTVSLQLLGRYIPLGVYNNFVIGPLVNACLFVSVIMVGWPSGVIVGLLSPFGAILTGSAIPLLFTPFIVAGNFLLVIIFNLLKKKRIIGIIGASIVKTTFLYVAIICMLSILKLPPKKSGMMLFLFSWPQLITALLGGVIAINVLNRLGKQITQKIDC